MGCGSYFCVELKLVEMRVRGRMVIWVRDGRNELQPLPMAINCASIERVKRKESSVRDRNNGDMSYDLSSVNYGLQEHSFPLL